MPIFRQKQLTRLCIAVVVVNTSACSYIQSLFPDKERDYQFTTEIAPLTLPPELNSSSAFPKPVAASQAKVVDNAVIDAEAAVPENSHAPADAEPTAERSSIQAELVKTQQGENRLRIAAPSAQAWRMVGKALSRKALEVTQRNQDDKSYIVQYNPNEEKVQDETLLDELRFMFGGFETGDKEYLIELQDIDPQLTEILITDKEHQSTAADGPGLSLLTLIRDAIKADVAGK
ncbi:MAG: outer membrane protein assembly factor BamC [Methylococcales bacterium]|nr:outer membrane protein assembly factor BamC [Methylococcaceae bacterium]